MLRDLIFQSLILTGLVSGIPIVAAAIVGFGITFLQAITQIQEQSILYLIKLAAAVISLLVCGGWLLAKFIRFYEECFYLIAHAIN